MKNQSIFRVATMICLSLILHIQTLLAQQPPLIRDVSTPMVEPLSLSGPRFGGLYILEADFSRIYEMSNHFSPENPINNFLTTFGWQFEKQFFATPAGTAGLIEFIPMISGFDQGLLIPSLNVLFGFRSAEGLEFGFGPNASIVGTGMVYAAGYTFRSDYVNFPINLAYIQGRDSQRIVFTMGFNLRQNTTASRTPSSRW
jgi:hypothetical protein